MKKTKTASHYGSVVFMVAVLFLSQLTGLSQITFAKTESEKVVADEHANIVIDYEMDEELKQIQWSMTYKKHAKDEAEYQMQFKLEIVEHEGLLLRESIQEIERTFGKVGPVDEEWYYAGDFSSENERIEIVFKSLIVEEYNQYHLKITPRLMKQTGDELEEIFIGDQTEYVVAVDLPENTAVSEINGEPTEISDKPEASREEPVENAQTEAEEVETYAANTLDSNLNGAFADAIPLNHLFARPSHIFTLAPNVATLDQDYRLSYITPSNLSSLLYNRGHMVSTSSNRIDFTNMSTDIGFTSYLYFDEDTEGITFFLHDGNPTNLFFSRRGIYNMYDPTAGHSPKSLGAYYHPDLLTGIAPIDKYIANGMILEFDNKISNGPLLNLNALGDREFSGAHIAAAPSGNPTTKSFKKDFGRNSEFSTGSWWKLDINITPAGMLTFTMEDLRQTGGYGITEGVININDYFTNLPSKKLYWGFTATAEFSLLSPRADAAIFLTNPRFEVQGELVHEITTQEQGVTVNVNGKKIPINTELEHTVTFYNEEGDGSIFLNPSEDNGITILTSDEEESKSNPFEFTELILLEDGYQPYFTYQELDSDGENATSIDVNAFYVSSTQRFYPEEAIEIPIGTEVTLHYKTKVKPEFQGLENHNVYERVEFIGRSGTTTGEYYHAQVEHAVEYEIQREPNHPPEIDNLRTTNEVFGEKNTFIDFQDPFHFTFDYLDPDLDRLYYSVWINDELLIENQIITDAEEEFKMHQSRGFKIDLKDSEGVFKLGENTIKLTLTDNRPINDEITYLELNGTFTVEGFIGFEFVTEEYSWKYARSQLPMNRQAQAREEGMRVVTRNTLNTSDSYRVTVSAEELNHVDMQHAISEEYLVFKNERGEIALSALTLEIDKKYEFSEEEGLLLRLNNQEALGVYSGTITWKIEDVL
ncbi:hypothetical protein [Enterococcus faecium]|uniref:WxL domain-containing protein n=1 Tax=Enterococcus faecium TaxID=1352 RepID=A0A7V7GP70_ENTFC|nr:hypothetical protein [Enterococcus faecium]KAA0691130.1 hypothetical protein DTX73_06345 [Enterococcus faecium]MBK5027963.1 hypothetical protein [Enterococcus faecium]MBK5038632.1 hypothetical protein [Enterococcus faecium]MBK5043626.1 hypothetical protein [Enterococcus faecium]MBK5068628.1 hypothetical protein [Enterococcus faecium]